MKNEKILLAILLVGIFTLLPGCKTVIVNPGGGPIAEYSMGVLEATMSQNIDTVYSATEKAIGQLELTVTSKTKDALSAQIIARDSLDKKISIKLYSTPEKATKLTIRVGTVGSENKSRLIYQKINENL